ncbi:MAG TPA: hypothetical protein VGQ42_17250 [Candidatus Dormibacteraeota bacterium]|nr:hypothetical protein [Candidatus Dormibacteraeota bacterium]
MIRAALSLVPAMALLAGCNSATPPGVVQATRNQPATSATPVLATAGAPAPAPLVTAAPSRAPAASATPVPAGHTGYVAPATVSGPVTLHPPAPGTYAYTMTSDSGSQSVSVAVSALQGSTDRLTWHSSNRGQSGQLDETLSWPGSAVFITEVMAHTGAVSYTCALSPPVKAAPSPLAAGDSWSSDSTCSVAGGTLHWTEQDHVTGTDTVQVGGVSVLTYLISVSRTVTLTGGATAFTSTTSARDWFAPSLGLEVRDESTSTASSGGKSKTGTSTLQLDSTQPQ